MPTLVRRETGCGGGRASLPRVIRGHLFWCTCCRGRRGCRNSLFCKKWLQFLRRGCRLLCPPPLGRADGQAPQMRGTNLRHDYLYKCHVKFYTFSLFRCSRLFTGAGSTSPCPRICSTCSPQSACTTLQLASCTLPASRNSSDPHCRPLSRKPQCGHVERTGAFCSRREQTSSQSGLRLAALAEGRCCTTHGDSRGGWAGRRMVRSTGSYRALEPWLLFHGRSWYIIEVEIPSGIHAHVLGGH